MIKNKHALLFVGVFVVFVYTILPAAEVTVDLDNSEIAEACQHLEYLMPLYSYKGKPENLDQSKKVTVLINHGYMVGYSTDRKQPLWAAYRVSKATRSTKYERPPSFFYPDLRLPRDGRINFKPEETFGKPYDRGHMVPNNAMNTQFGKLGQLESFLWSNICPQKADLNRGPWMRMEHKVTGVYSVQKKQVWVLAGPIFAENTDTVKDVDIPSEFFMILASVRYYKYGYVTSLLGIILPQDMKQNAKVTSKYLNSIDEIEEKTKLDFFPEFTEKEADKYEKEPANKMW